MEKAYDYLIVGSGLMGATFARLAHKAGKRCLVVEKRDHTGGNVYCREVEGILDGRAPSNLEEQAMTLVGRDIYGTLIKGYTEKQWGRAPNCQPSSSAACPGARCYLCRSTCRIPLL